MSSEEQERESQTGRSRSRSSRSRSRSRAQEQREQDTQEEGQAQRPELERAEEVIGRVSERVGHWLNLASVQAMTVYARAREEVEDIFAEAQEISRKRRSDGSE